MVPARAGPGSGSTWTRTQTWTWTWTWTVAPSETRGVYQMTNSPGASTEQNLARFTRTARFERIAGTSPTRVDVTANTPPEPGLVAGQDQSSAEFSG